MSTQARRRQARARQKARLLTLPRQRDPFLLAMQAAFEQQKLDQQHQHMAMAMASEEKKRGSAVAVCIKAANLRKMTPKSYDNLLEWMDDRRNVYVGRGERVGIKDPVTGKTLVHGIKGSKWANPFKVKQHGLDKALTLYEQHLYAVRPDGSRLVDDIEELRGKRLGCWCSQREPCHAQILVQALER